MVAIALKWAHVDNMADLVLVADPDAPTLAREHVVDVAREAGASTELQGRVRLAVSEAVSNAVRHAYRDGGHAEPEIRVSTAVEDGGLRVAVIDDGVGLQAPGAEPGMGLGLAIMDAIADDVEVRTHSGIGTELWLRFTLVADVARA